MAPLDDKAQMEEILRSEAVGHLAMTAEGEVYLVPLNYTYDAGRVLFHCALQGRKLDMIRAQPKVCFEVCRQAGPPLEHQGQKCDPPFASVICWGTARVIDDLQERQEVLQAFQARYATPENPRTPITAESAAGCGAVAITVTRMTGRQAKGDNDARWAWSAED
jgi:hypothetical protein